MLLCIYVSYVGLDKKKILSSHTPRQPIEYMYLFSCPAPWGDTYVGSEAGILPVDV